MDSNRPSAHRRTVASIAALALALSLTLVGVVTGAPPSAGYVTQNASFSGISCSGDNTVSSWGSVQVPANAITASIQAIGGGGAGGDNWDANGGTGGGGGIVNATFNVTPGHYVFAKVGCGAYDGGGNADGYTKGGSGGPYGGGGGGSTAVCVNTNGAGSCGSGTVMAIAAGGGGGGRAFDGSACSNYNGGSGGTGNTGVGTSGSQHGGTTYGGARGSNGGGGTNGGGGGGGGGQGPGQNTGATTGNSTGGPAGSAEGDGGNNGGNASSVNPGGSGGNGGNGVGRDNVISGGGGGGYTGGGSGGGGDDGSGCDNESGSGGGAGASWVRDGLVSSSWGNAGWDAGNCTNTGIGTLPGGGGNRGVGGCDGNATISFLINTVPTGASQNISVTKGVATNITLQASDAAGEGTPSCANVSGLSANKGSRTGSGCSYSYTPNANTSGSDSFTYQVLDANGALSTTYTITLNIVNRAPTGAAQTLSATKGTGLGITLGTSDLDSDSPLTCNVSGLAQAKGTLTGSGCSRTFTANANTTGSDTFTYTVSDAYGGTSPSYTITLNIGNRAPTSAAQTVTVTAGQTTSITLEGSDPDGDTTTCATTAASAGTLQTGTSCTRSYTAPATAGTYSFTYTRSDAYSGISPSATVTLNVVIPDVAITKSHVGTFNDGEQGTYTIGVSNVGSAATVGTITVIDDLPLGMTYASANVTGSGFGCVPQLGGTRVSCTRTTALPAAGSTSFTITVNLEDGTPSSPNTATVSASPDHSSANNTATDPTNVNLRPEAVSFEVETGVDEPVAVTLEGSDPEGAALAYSVGVPTSGALSGVAPNLTFTPANGSDVDVTFTYTVTDPNGHTSYAATVTVRVIRPGTRGRVTSDATGFGISGVTVRLYEDGVGFTDDSAVTDGSGLYDLGDEVPDGTYRVIFKDPAQDYVDEWFDDSPLRSTSTTIDVVEGGEVIADAGLAVGAQINVTISNSGPFTVALYNTGPVGASAYRSISGVTGSTALRGLPAGTYYVSVADPSGLLSTRWSGNVADRADAVGIPVTAGGTANRSLTLQSPVSIGGTILDAFGPAEDITVQAYTTLTNTFVKSAKTNASGAYAIKGLTAGGYKLVFRDSTGEHPVTWYGGASAASAANIAVNNGDPQAIDTELPMASTVTGTVTGGPEGTTPLAGAKVTLYLDNLAVRTYVADASGVYTATGLAGGQYTVLFNATGHRIEYNLDAYKKADADAVTLVAGDTLTVDATLTPV